MKLFKKGKNVSVKRIVAALLAVVMVCGYLPTNLGNSASAEGTISFGKEVDPNTAKRPVELFAGTTLNAGRVMVGKTVSADGEDFSSEAKGAVWDVTDPENFLVTISQASQAMGISSEIPVPIDAVFVLDTSGSMNREIGSNKQTNDASK